MSKDARLVCVQKCYGLDVAEIFKSKLEANGIPALLEFESAAKLYGLTVDGLGEVRVMVSEDDAPEALELLAEVGEQPDIEETED
jgi:hypothetical protein